MELVIVNNGKATTTSLVVAGYFGKRHADVIRTIETMLQDADIFSRRNFALAEYTDEQGKPRPMYELDRDGFTLLAMGFTGKQALQFKLSYIDAFNKAEEALKQVTAQLPADPIMAQLQIMMNMRQDVVALSNQIPVLSTGIAETRHELQQLKEERRLENWQQQAIQKAVNHKVDLWKELYPSLNVKKAFMGIWRHLKEKFQVPRYNEIPAIKYEQALTAINKLNMQNLAGL